MNRGVILCMVCDIFIFCKEIAIKYVFKKEEEKKRGGGYIAIFQQYILISEKMYDTEKYIF